MKVVIEVELGNDAMQTPADVFRAIHACRCFAASDNEPFQDGEEFRIADVNGLIVGTCKVIDS